MTPEFRLLKPSEVPQAVTLLAQAFATDPSMAYFLGPRPEGTPSRWDRQLGALLTLVLRSAMRGGDEVIGLYLDSRLAAVAITEDRRPRLGQALRRSWAELASLVTVGRSLPWAVLSRVEAYRRAVRQAHSTQLAYYLVMVGVAPEFRSQGLGHQLFSFLVDGHLGVWGLDTENPANLAVYRRWGLTHKATLRLATLEVFLLSYEEGTAAR